MLIGEKIREARVGAGMTQAELANVLKCSVKTINRIEHNKKEITVEEIKTLNRLFDVDFLQETNDQGDTLAEEKALSTLNHISLSVDDIKLEIIRNERIKTLRIITLFVIVFILIFLIFFLITDWRSPNKTTETIVVEYIYNEKG